MTMGKSYRNCPACSSLVPPIITHTQKDPTTGLSPLIGPPAMLVHAASRVHLSDIDNISPRLFVVMQRIQERTRHALPRELSLPKIHILVSQRDLPSPVGAQTRFAVLDLIGQNKHSRIADLQGRNDSKRARYGQKDSIRIRLADQEHWMGSWILGGWLCVWVA
jgi:hypothetical protein